MNQGIKIQKDKFKGSELVIKKLFKENINSKAIIPYFFTNFADNNRFPSNESAPSTEPELTARYEKKLAK